MRASFNQTLALLLALSMGSIFPLSCALACEWGRVHPAAAAEVAELPPCHQVLAKKQQEREDARAKSLAERLGGMPSVKLGAPEAHCPLQSWVQATALTRIPSLTLLHTVSIEAPAPVPAIVALVPSAVLTPRARDSGPPPHPLPLYLERGVLRI